MIITLKSGPLAGTKMLDVVAVAKSLIEPEDLRNGGVLLPQQAAKLINMLFKDGFLAKINTIRMGRLTRNVDVMDILERQLVRVAQGSEPDNNDLTSAAEFGCKLTALDAQLFASLTLDFLRDNKDNPNLQKEVEAGFNTRLANDIVDLGFNGVADDGVGADRAAKFIRLNKGWLQIMRDAANTPKVDIDPAVDGWVTDAEWGDMFGATLSAAVQQFRTDGAAMQQSIESAGAGATNLGMAMTEQIALLGMMQGQMQSGEAGTALASFARNAARAHEAFADLGGTRVRLLDENDQLRAMPDILADLSARYGETLEASEAYEIQQALGSDEAMRLINALYGQEAAVRANAEALGEAGAQGAEFTEAIAEAGQEANRYAGITVLGQQIDTLWQAIGDRLLPAVNAVLPYIEAAIASIIAWIDANPELVTQIGAVVVAVGAVAAAIAPVLIGIGGLIASWAVMSYGATRLFLTVGNLARVFLWLGRALLANPIGLAVAAIAGAAYLIWQNWEPVSAWFADLWDDVTDIFGGVGDFLGGIFTGDMGRAVQGLEAIWNGVRGFFSTLWEGIGGIFTYAYENWIRPVLDALGITEEVEAAWTALSGFFSGLLGDIGTYFTGLGEVVAGVLTGDMDRAMAGAQTALEGLRSFYDRVLNAIGAIFTTVWETVIRPVTDALGVTEEIEAAWNAVSTALGTVLDGIGSIFSTMWGVVEPIVSALGSPGGVGAAWEAVKTALQAPLDWISTKFQEVMGFIQPVLDALNWTLDNGAAAVAALGGASSVMDGRETPEPGDTGAAPPGTTTPPALTGGSTPYTSIPSATDMLGLQGRARGGAFRPGWLLTGEDGPELEYRSEGGFIAHHGALRGMLAMAERTRALMNGAHMDALAGLAASAVPQLATVAAAGPALQRGPVTLQPTYNMPISFDGAVDMAEVRATVAEALADHQERAEAALRSLLHD